MIKLTVGILYRKKINLTKYHLFNCYQILMFRTVTKFKTTLQMLLLAI